MKYLILALALCLTGCNDPTWNMTEKQKSVYYHQEKIEKSIDVEAVIIRKYEVANVYNAHGTHSIKNYDSYVIEYVDQSDLQIYSSYTLDITRHEYARLLPGNLYKFKIIKGGDINELVEYENK